MNNVRKLTDEGSDVGIYIWISRRQSFSLRLCGHWSLERWMIIWLVNLVPKDCKCTGDVCLKRAGL